MWGYRTCWCSHNPDRLGRVCKLVQLQCKETVPYANSAYLMLWLVERAHIDVRHWEYIEHNRVGVLLNLHKLNHTRAFFLHSTVAVRKCDGIFFRTVAAWYTLVGVAGGIITRTGAATIQIHLPMLAGWRHWKRITSASTVVHLCKSRVIFSTHFTYTCWSQAHGDASRY